MIVIVLFRAQKEFLKIKNKILFVNNFCTIFYIAVTVTMMAFLTLLGTSWTWKGRAFVGEKVQGDVSKFTTILMMVRIQPPESSPSPSNLLQSPASASRPSRGH